MIQVYTGDGKGKTTAALGLCFRAAGHGKRSIVFFFMKGFIEYGELGASEKMGGLIEVVQCGRASFVDKDNPDPVDVRMAREGFEKAVKAISSGNYDIVVLDELSVALDFNLIPLDDVLNLIEGLPSKLEIIITGRYANQAIIDHADLVTEMREVKHYYRKGIQSRKGIEF
ncbi:MAG TPA: cob(I)yrinic acid a,c-diamide adenosyltransferase [Acidobacteriota bacterium]|nr:cob(I)yrinic acid a,c-diamide adenosyltransferase [Acidobacteriota bacterium]